MPAAGKKTKRRKTTHHVESDHAAEAEPRPPYRCPTIEDRILADVEYPTCDVESGLSPWVIAWRGHKPLSDHVPKGVFQHDWTEDDENEEYFGFEIAFVPFDPPNDGRNDFASGEGNAWKRAKLYFVPRRYEKVLRILFHAVMLEELREMQKAVEAENQKLEAKRQLRRSTRQKKGEKREKLDNYGFRQLILPDQLRWAYHSNLLTKFLVELDNVVKAQSTRYTPLEFESEVLFTFIWRECISATPVRHDPEGRVAFIHNCRARGLRPYWGEILGQEENIDNKTYVGYDASDEEDPDVAAEGYASVDMTEVIRIFKEFRRFDHTDDNWRASAPYKAILRHGRVLRDACRYEEHRERFLASASTLVDFEEEHEVSFKETIEAMFVALGNRPAMSLDGFDRIIEVLVRFYMVGRTESRASTPADSEDKVERVEVEAVLQQILDVYILCGAFRDNGQWIHDNQMGDFTEALTNVRQALLRARMREKLLNAYPRLWEALQNFAKNVADYTLDTVMNHPKVEEVCLGMDKRRYSQAFGLLQEYFTEGHNRLASFTRVTRLAPWPSSARGHSPNHGGTPPPGSTADDEIHHGDTPPLNSPLTPLDSTADDESQHGGLDSAEDETITPPPTHSYAATIIDLVSLHKMAVKFQAGVEWDGVEDPPTFKDLLTRVSDLLGNDALRKEITSRFDRVITGLDFLKKEVVDETWWHIAENQACPEPLMSDHDYQNAVDTVAAFFDKMFAKYQDAKKLGGSFRSTESPPSGSHGQSGGITPVKSTGPNEKPASRQSGGIPPAKNTAPEQTPASPKSGGMPPSKPKGLANPPSEASTSSSNKGRTRKTEIELVTVSDVADVFKLAHKLWKCRKEEDFDQPEELKRGLLQVARALRSSTKRAELLNDHDLLLTNMLPTFSEDVAEDVWDELQDRLSCDMEEAEWLRTIQQFARFFEDAWARQNKHVKPLARKRGAQGKGNSAAAGKGGAPLTQTNNPQSSEPVISSAPAISPKGTLTATVSSEPVNASAPATTPQSQLSATVASLAKSLVVLIMSFHHGEHPDANDANIKILSGLHGLLFATLQQTATFFEHLGTLDEKVLRDLFWALRPFVLGHQFYHPAAAACLEEHAITIPAADIHQRLKSLGVDPA